MTVDGILKNENFSPIVVSDGLREIKGAYCGDLLSWVMGRAEENNAFITIMTNINVLAVASLINVSVVILCEDVTVDDEIINAAKEKEINLIKTSLSSYETCVLLSKLI